MGVEQGLVTYREDLGFYPEGGGSPGAPWSEEGQDPNPNPHQCPLVVLRHCRQTLYCLRLQGISSYIQLSSVQSLSRVRLKLH